MLNQFPSFAVQEAPQPLFAFLSELAEKIYVEGQHGSERKKTVDLLKTWQCEVLATVTLSQAEAERLRALSEALELAIKIVQNAFIPP